MAREYLFRLEILNKKNTTPLYTIAQLSGEKQYNILSNKTYAPENENKVLWNNLLIPSKDSDRYKNLPDYLKIKNKRKDIIANARNVLWKSVDNKEVRPDSQFARLFELRIPNFLSLEESVALVEKFSSLLTLEGMIVDASIHQLVKVHSKNTIHDLLSNKKDLIANDPEVDVNTKGNTVFLMTTLRSYDCGRFKNKNRDWNDFNFLKSWRNSWLNLLTESISLSTADFELKKSWDKRISVLKNHSNKATSRHSNKANPILKIA